MDKEVLIKFIDMIGAVLGRINSKRLLTLYAFYYWLYSVMNVIGATWTASMGGMATLIVLWSFYVENKQSKEIDAL